MKKAIMLISVLILLCSVLSACDKKENNVDSDSTTTTSDTTRDDKYETTAPLYTVGDVQTSEKIENGEGEYNIAYYDANGAGARMDVYRNGKLVYYYTSSSVDDLGNCIQQKYYTADGKYIGAFDNGYFFDENGQQITEDVFESKLNK